jgi:hypothetical protein
MNIIFKTNEIAVADKYTVLELDTFRLADGTLHTACCVIENIPIPELPQTASFKQLHADLILNYGLQDWNYCEQAIEQLTGKWGGECDTFYADLLTRIDLLKTQILDDDWTPVILKD